MSNLNVNVFYFNNDDDYSSSLIKNLNDLGIKSGISQSLNGPITTLEKLKEEKNNVNVVLIVYIQDNKTIGYLKYGYKNLYFYTKKGELLNYSDCLSLLDFYVDDNYQRKGIGKILFEEFLKTSKINSPALIAYDRPSPLLYSFLSSAYQLNDLDLQPNRYAISNQFFLLKSKKL